MRSFFACCAILAVVMLMLSAPISSEKAQATEVVRCSVAHTISQDMHIRVDGLQRTYLVHVPQQQGRLPLIFAFHGRGETPEQLASYSGLSALPAILVYPRGMPGRGGKLSWSGTPTADPHVNDIRFVDMTLHKLEQTFCIDQKRVYATGKSDGAGLAMQLACADADRFAAVAAVAGAYYPIAGGCNPQRTISILEIHGTGDRVVPYHGSSRRQLPSIMSWLSAWAERDDCDTSYHVRAIAEDVVRERWGACRNNVVVEGYRIRDGGHTWPGALAPSGPGFTSHAISARDVIAGFFARHPM